MPLLIIAAGIVLMLIAISIKRNHNVAFVLTCIIILASHLSTSTLYDIAPHKVGELLIIDPYALFFFGLISFASLIVALISRPYLEKKTEGVEEYYVLLLLTTLGASTLVASHHFVSLFLGFEILSTSLYVLIAFIKQRELSFEAGVKYLVLAAVSSAFLLFGMALVFAATGSMYFPEIASLLRNNPVALLTIIGFSLMIVGIGFKLALVPFHLWIPDVYEGSPAPVTALVASVSKVGVFALWLRFITELDAFRFPSLIMVFSIIAAASMLAGNLLALFQTNVKRVLAYSSIAHMGYLMVAFLIGSKMAAEASTFYLVTYTITILGAFGVVTMLSGNDRDAASIDEYRGLYKRKPWLAFVFTLMLLSLAGIPLTAGFLGKFYVLMTGVEASLWWLVIILIVSSTIGLFYYLRIVAAMFSPAGTDSPTIGPSSGKTIYAIVSAVLVILLVWIGTYPAALLSLISDCCGSF
jgi:NADH-quinone oxidoreductase subunit N